MIGPWECWVSYLNKWPAGSVSLSRESVKSDRISLSLMSD